MCFFQERRQKLKEMKGGLTNTKIPVCFMGAIYGMIKRYKIKHRKRGEK